MARISAVFVLSALAILASAVPVQFQKRIAQTIADSTHDWEQAFAPKNQELNGLFHCQFAGSDFTKFSGDQTGNVPLGLSAVTPPGSCPAKPDGPVPDGVQLNTLVTSPTAKHGALSGLRP
ncbi:hypothetical protein C0993_001470 [Termitomyces sp. T159_Od127]|nr:hypothetical protein C0993_001470 [Termitomyces sp. T159_Od127]